MKKLKTKPDILTKAVLSKILSVILLSLLLALIGVALYLVISSGFQKSLVDELWRFKTVLVVILIATFAYQVYFHKLDGALSFFMRIAIFVSIYTIVAHFLLQYYPSYLWLSDLIVPTALGILVSQIVSSYKFAIWLIVAVAVSFGTVYISTFDLGISTVIVTPWLIGILSGSFALLLTSKLLSF